MSSSDNVTGPKRGDCKRTIRCQPPDVIVAVGSGRSKQEFECYKVVLSFASEYLDIMLSSNMKEQVMSRIEFPDKDPEEWKEFYQFIAPQEIGELPCHAQLNDRNALTLLPWFHEFQMGQYVKRCDDILAKHYLKEDMMSFCWQRGRSCLGKRKDKFGKIMTLLELSHMYNLKATREQTEKTMSVLLLSRHTQDLFDPAVVKSILQLVSPLALDDENGLRMSEGESKHLWPQIEKVLLPHTPWLSQEVIDSAHFPHLFYSYMQIVVEKSRAQREKVDKTFLVRSINELMKIPDVFHPWAFISSSKDAKRCCKKFLVDHYNSNKNLFDDLGINPPPS